MANTMSRMTSMRMSHNQSVFNQPNEATKHRPRYRTALTGVVTLSLILGLSACGGGGDAPFSDPPSSQSSTQTDNASLSLGGLVVSEQQQLIYAKGLVSDLRLWNQTVQIQQPDQLFNTHYTVFDETLMPAMQTLKPALTRALQWGALPAVPELAFSSYCGQLSGLLQTLCTSILSPTNLQNQCAKGEITFFGIEKLLGVRICDLLSTMTLVRNRSLNVTYHFFDRQLDIVGTLNGQQVDLILTADKRSATALTFNATGTLTNNGAQLTLNPGTKIHFAYAQTINVFALQPPKSITLTLVGRLADTSTTSNLTNTFNGTMVLQADLSGLAGKGVNPVGTTFEHLVQTNATLLDNEPVPFDFTLNGTLSTGDQSPATSQLHIAQTLTTGTTTSTRAYQLVKSVKANDNSLDGALTITGTITDGTHTSTSPWQYNTAELSYSADQVTTQTLHFTQPSNRAVTVEAYDRLTLQLDFSDIDTRDPQSQQEPIQVGTLFFDNNIEGTIFRDIDGNLSVTYQDGTEDILFYAL